MRATFLRITEMETSKQCEIYSKLTITTPARRHLAFPLLALSKQMLAGKEFLHWEIVNLKIVRNF